MLLLATLVNGRAGGGGSGSKKRKRYHRHAIAKGYKYDQFDYLIAGGVGAHSPHGCLKEPDVCQYRKEVLVFILVVTFFSCFGVAAAWFMKIMLTTGKRKLFAELSMDVVNVEDYKYNV